MKIQFINPKKNGFTSGPKHIFMRLNLEESALYELCINRLFLCRNSQKHYVVLLSSLGLELQKNTQASLTAWLK